MIFTSRLFPGLFRKIPALIILCFLCTELQSQSKTLGLTKKLNGNDENGYILFTPLSTDTTFLINKCGQRLHYWRSKYTPGLSVYLKPNGNLLKTGTYTDTVFGFAGGRGGIIEEFDWDNKLVWRYKLFNDSLCQHHDIKLLPNGNVLVLAWHSISRNKALALGRSPLNFGTVQKDLWGERILELKPIGIDSAEVVWEWDLFDHIVQDWDSTKPNYGMINQHPELMNINYALNLKTNDWIHANSLDYNEQLDQIVISGHNNSEIWIIDHSTTKAESKTHFGGTFDKGGDLLYRWGNPAAYNMGTSLNRKLFRQHNANWIPNGYRDSGCIMIFNNGWERDTAYSSVDIIRTPILSNGSYVATLPYGPPGLAWKYRDSVPKAFYSQIISGAQRLPNGNTLICSGVQGRFFEVTPAGKTVWQYRNPVNSFETQIDGQNPKNNQVFRCEYYPKNFAAFKNRTLTPGQPIEKNSYIYSCIYETVPPKIVSFSPGKNDTSILSNTPLTLTLDETVVKLGGEFKIYQDSVLFETVSVQSDLVKISNNVVTIEHPKPFSVNAKISVSLSANSFRDSSNNSLAQSISTTDWFFYTIKAFPKIISLSPAHTSNNAKVNARLVVGFSEEVSKAASGNISIFENGTFKETIPVGSTKVVLDGMKAIITPSVDFSPNAFVLVTMDSCFIDYAGIKNTPIADGAWYFRTAALPKVISMTPALNASEVGTEPVMTIEFDKSLSIDSLKDIQVFENNVLLELIQVNDGRITIAGNILSIDPLRPFAPSSRISVVIPGNMLKDTFGLFFSGIDSSNWHFTIAAPSSVNPVSERNFISVYPNPGNGKWMLEMNVECSSVVLFDFTGKRIECAINMLANGLYEIDAQGISQGHYILLVNGEFVMKMEVN